MILICPSCSGKRLPGKYLCWSCWWGLSQATRYALRRQDDLAVERLQQLYEALNQKTPLKDIRINV